MNEPKKTVQEMILSLYEFWSKQGCLVLNAYDTEKGAGTMNPNTFLRAVGPEPWAACFVEPSRRPADGRYGENPNRLYQHHQFQVVMKPNPENIQELYIESLGVLGIDAKDHDIRFVEDNWENPSMGCAGLGWEVWIDGMEVTQFTYFQQVGGLEVAPTMSEITYGLERLASYIQDVESVYDLEWSNGVKYGEIFKQPEYEHSVYSFEKADGEMLRRAFDQYEHEAAAQIENGLVYPAYDYILKCSHTFNLMDAGKLVSVSDRQNYLSRVRRMAHQVASLMVDRRKELEYPLLSREDAEALLKEEAHE